LLGDLSVSAWLIPLLAAREINDDFRGFLAAIAVALLKGLLIPLGLGLLGWRLIHSELVRLLVLVPAVAALAVGLMWTQLATYERSHLLNLIKVRLAH
jgi:uncharacterized membrane protein